MGVGDGVRQLEAEQACRHALENRHFAVVVADVVLGLAPTVGCERAARQSQQYHDGDDDGDHTVASGARALRFALLDMLVADGFGDFRIVRIGGNAAVVLLYDGDFTGVGIGAVAVLLAYRGRLRHALFRRIVVLVGILAVAQCCGTGGRRLLALAQCGSGCDRLVDDVGDRLKACAGRAANQWRLMRQIERVRVKGERRVGDDRGDVVGAAGTKRHRNQLLRALLLIGAGGQHLLQCGILKHAAQTVGAEQPAVGRMCLAYGDVRTRIDIEITQNAHHDVALRMVARLGLADAAGVDQMLHVAVVGRHADQTAVMQQICAGIADMRQNPISGHQCDRRDGGAHARETTFALRFANDRVMRGHNRGFHHVGDNLDIALHVVLLDMRQ